MRLVRIRTGTLTNRQQGHACLYVPLTFLTICRKTLHRSHRVSCHYIATTEIEISEYSVLNCNPWLYIARTKWCNRLLSSRDREPRDFRRTLRRMEAIPFRGKGVSGSEGSWSGCYRQQSDIPRMCFGDGNNSIHTVFLYDDNVG
jgi:hypothetical protein